MFLKAKLPIWVFVLIAAIGLATSFLLVNYSISVLSELGLQSLENVYWTKNIPKTNELTNWKTYRNYEYGFEVKYPPWMEVSEENRVGSLVGFYSMQGFPCDIAREFCDDFESNFGFVDIFILDNEKNLDIKSLVLEIVAEYEEDFGVKLFIDETEVLIDIKNFQDSQMNGMAVTKFNTYGDVVRWYVAIKKDNKVILIEGCGISELGEKEVPIFNKILSTFKFIE
ncbi:MAG: hypothetical protein ACOZAL_03555 [Patescibacteria group bacterium]